MSRLRGFLMVLGVVLLLAVGVVSAEYRAAREGVSVQIPILMYHHFDESDIVSTIISAELFESHLIALRDAGFNAISFEELLDFVENGSPLPENPFIITIDDGNLSVYESAFPLLVKYDMKATSFVVGIHVGKSTYRNTGNWMIPRFDEAQALEMFESGYMSIQSHSFDMHQYAPYERGAARVGVLRLEDESEDEYFEAFVNDFELAAAQIEGITGERVFVYSYPYGRFSALTEELLRDLGVLVTLSVRSGVNTVVVGEPDGLFGMLRYNVPGDMSAEELVGLLRGLVA